MIAIGFVGHASLLDCFGTLQTMFAIFGCCFGVVLVMFSVVVNLVVEMGCQELDLLC